jgi:hypothetical protein
MLAVVSRLFSNRMLWIITGLFFLYSLPFLFLNQSRPWVLKKNIFNHDAVDQYFVNYKELKKPFSGISEIIHQNNLSDIGWMVNGDTWEYPMWVLLNDIDNLRMEHINIDNETHVISQQKQFMNFIAEGIISTRAEKDLKQSFFYQNKKYYLAYRWDNWRLYVMSIDE